MAKPMPTPTRPGKPVRAAPGPPPPGGGGTAAGNTGTYRSPGLQYKPPGKGSVVGRGRIGGGKKATPRPRKLVPANPSTRARMPGLRVFGEPLPTVRRAGGPVRAT